MICIEYRSIYLDNKPSKYIINCAGVIKNSITGKQLSTASTDKDGYPIVNLVEDGKHYTKKVHRLVAERFIINPNNKPEIHHIDKNRKNFHADNLIWCTKDEHFNIERESGNKFIRARGENHGSTKLTDDMVYRIAIELSKGYSRRDISVRYGVSTHILHKIYNKISWTHITDGIEFPKINNRPRTKYSYALKYEIIILLSVGYSTKSVIELLNLEKCDRVKNYIKTLKRRHITIDKGSTTIERDKDKYYVIDINL